MRVPQSRSQGRFVPRGPYAQRWQLPQREWRRGRDSAWPGRRFVLAFRRTRRHPDTTGCLAGGSPNALRLLAGAHSSGTFLVF